MFKEVHSLISCKCVFYCYDFSARQLYVYLNASSFVSKTWFSGGPVWSQSSGLCNLVWCMWWCFSRACFWTHLNVPPKHSCRMTMPNIWWLVALGTLPVLYTLYRHVMVTGSAELEVCCACCFSISHHELLAWARSTSLVRPSAKR